MKRVNKQVCAWKVKLNSFTVKMRQTVVKFSQIIDFNKFRNNWLSIIYICSSWFTVYTKCDLNLEKEDKE